MNRHRGHVLIVTLIATCSKFLVLLPLLVVLLSPSSVVLMVSSQQAQSSGGDGGGGGGDRFGLNARTKFIFYDQNNRETADKSCYATHRYAMIVHGYQETCDTFWVRELRKNLLEHRSGCIICMDYSDYNREYPSLFIHFKTIAKILQAKLTELRDKSFHSPDAFLFGFSFGARLITRAAADFGSKQIGLVHLCDPAGPGFSFQRGVAEPRIVAGHSQCFHTDSEGYGTLDRACHQDWHLGDCGVQQSAAGPKPLGSHGLCPVFYNLSFKHRFMAVKKSKACNLPINKRDLIWLPVDGIRMGYMQTITNATVNDVNLYVVTKPDPPYV